MMFTDPWSALIVAFTLALLPISWSCWTRGEGSNGPFVAQQQVLANYFGDVFAEWRR